jgi:Ner family transcriptional regulator
MNTHHEPKKTADPLDWHPADIVASLRKAGWSLRRLSHYHGYTPTALGTALSRPWPKAERLIAEAIGVSPETIWPSRQKRRSYRTCSSEKRNNDSTFALDTERKSVHRAADKEVDAA